LTQPGCSGNNQRCSANWRTSLQRGVASAALGCYDAIVNTGANPGRGGIATNDASETFAQRVRRRFSGGLRLGGKGRCAFAVVLAVLTRNLHAANEYSTLPEPRRDDPSRNARGASSPEHRMKIKSQKDFFAGLMFAVVGIAFAWGATTYNIGAGARMGPGYFPLMLGILLAGLGAFIIFESLVVATEDGEPVGKWAWKPLGFIIGANLLFGILLGGLPSIGLPAMGMVVAIYGLTFVASLAGDEFSFKENLVLATILAIGSYLAFIVLLKLQFQVWPTFITG
jgi:hypothetical protein